MSDEPPAGGEGRPPTDAAAAVWQEGPPGHCVIKLRDYRAWRSASEEDRTVGAPGGNNHSPSLSEHKSSGPEAGVSVAWVEAAPGEPSGPGRIMWQSFRSGAGGDAADGARVPPAANDNATWVTGPQGMGAFGYAPTIASLDGGDTLVAWVGADGSAHGRLYPPDAEGADAPEYASVNAALGDLGPAVAGADGGRRVQVAEPRPGTFAVMWLALADSGLSLRGSLFLVPPDDAATGDSGPWTGQPMADIRLPAGSTGAFSLGNAGADSGDLLVSYSVLDPATGGVRVLARQIEMKNEGRGIGHASPEFEPSGAAPVDYNAHASAHPGHHAPMPAEPNGGGHHTAAVTSGAPAGAAEQAPIVKAMPEGFVVAWNAPTDIDGVVQIRLSIFDAQGAPRVLADGSTVIAVTDSAEADVAPAISGFGSGAVVAYVNAGDGGLTVKAYDGAGGQIGRDAVVDPGDAGPISEIAIDAEPVPVPGGNGAVQEQVAVVYVRESADVAAGGSDYGTIYLQRYAVEGGDGQPAQLVELGVDGEHDGTDAPAQLTTETDGNPATTEPVYGRAPVVETLADGQVAIAWVESQDAVETIKGRVLAPDGSQVMLIDLSELIGEGGIARNTKPILLDTAQGDILVNWLQPDGDGHVVMSARYEADGAGGWLMPELPTRLQAFDDEPDEFSVSLTEAESTFLTVTWETDGSGSSGGGSVLSQRFDIDGQDVGRVMRVDESALDHAAQPSSDAFGAAGLADGKIVIVYTEQTRNGGVDLATHVVEVTGVATDPGASSAPLADTFEFAPEYVDGSIRAEVIDMTHSQHTTYQQLVNSGALVEPADHAVAALDPADPASTGDKALKAIIEASVLADAYLKFS